MQVGFDATMFETAEDIIYVKIPKLMPSSLALGFRFNIPFPSIPVYRPSNSHDEDEDGPAEKESAGPGDDEEDMQLVIHASAAGNLRRMKHAGPLPGTGEDGEIEVCTRNLVFQISNPVSYLSIAWIAASFSGQKFFSRSFCTSCRTGP